MGILRRRFSLTRCTYAIDLLKGEGLPMRSRPGGIAFACLVVVVPVLVVMAIVSFYTDCKVVIAIQEQQVDRLETGLQALSSAVQKKEALEQEKAEATRTLAEAKSALSGRTQWSPALAWLVENLSDRLVLTRLEVRQGTTRAKVPAKGDPGRKIDMNVPVRELKICVCGQEESSAEAVQKLQNSLRSSAAIGPMLDTITVSQNTMTLESREAVLYELNCVFKPVLQ